jgi:cell division protein FtsB
MQALQCRRRRNRLRNRRLVATVVTALACMMFLAWVRLDNVALGYRVADQEARLVELKAERTALRAEYARLVAPDRLRVAAEDLGMVMPEPGQVIPVDATKVVEAMAPESASVEVAP